MIIISQILRGKWEMLHKQGNQWANLCLLEMTQVLTEVLRT